MPHFGSLPEAFSRLEEKPATINPASLRHLLRTWCKCSSSWPARCRIQRTTPLLPGARRRAAKTLAVRSSNLDRKCRPGLSSTPLAGQVLGYERNRKANGPASSRGCSGHLPPLRSHTGSNLLWLRNPLLRPSSRNPPPQAAEPKGQRVFTPADRARLHRFHLPRLVLVDGGSRVAFPLAPSR